MEATPEELWLAHMKRESRKNIRAMLFWFGVSAIGAIGMAIVFLCGH